MGVSKYAIIQPKPKIPCELGKLSKASKDTKSRKKTTPKKRTCRSNTRRSTVSTKKPTGATTRTQTSRSRARTLSEQRSEKYGIGSAPSTTNRTRQNKVDYLKLNDGLEEPSESLKSPKQKCRCTHLPLRSGPSSTRQKAQKTVTSPPAQVLAIPSS